MKNVATSINIGRAKALAQEPPEAGRPGAEERGRAMRGLRRRFTARYKLSILRQADRAVAEGGGALERLLAREGLYSSHLAQWRKRHLEGSLKDARRGRKALSRRALLLANRNLRRSLELLEAELREMAGKLQPLRDSGPGVCSHAVGFLRRRLLDLAGKSRAYRCGEAVRMPASGKNQSPRE